ncbi:ATP-binding cassette domain-containing protein [Corynebacterium macclintockiae]|uniref:ATP-binding cassette domain-containing protein n=1 Tax=Corynebacterium TaxID=1716 RepID=UPI0006914D91|nr:ATP-binding cassette domain-containing protein [Corynebacterium sp. HMSC058E07]OFM60971.1 ABC transporter ATP-binding protein [Corynebacterium sp. HMSC058E07]
MTSLAVEAQDLELKGDEGQVFGPLSFSIPNQGLTNLLGKGGSGRTALALVLSGRMKPTGGTLNVLGETKPKQIRSRVAIAGVEQIDLLERSVTVQDILTESLSWSKPWFMPMRKATAEDLQRICSQVYGERDLPPLDAYISQLDNLDKIMLRISLALSPADNKPVHLLIMDDIEQVHENDERAILLQVLERLSMDIPVVVNSSNPIVGPVEPTTVIEIDAYANHAHPIHTGLREYTDIAEPKENN